MLELWASANDWLLMLLTIQLKLKIKKGHTPSITTVTITVYLKENGNKKGTFTRLIPHCINCVIAFHFWSLFACLILWRCTKLCLSTLGTLSETKSSSQTSKTQSKNVIRNWTRKWILSFPWCHLLCRSTVHRMFKFGEWFW